MKAATRMMLMGNRSEKQGNNNEGYGARQDSTMQRRHEGYGNGHMSARKYPGRSPMTGNQYGGMGAREPYDDDDYDEYGEHGKPQRMYAAGMAWSDRDMKRRKGKKWDDDEDDDEEDEHKGNRKHGRDDEPKEVDEECAMKWVRAMKATDGTTMPKYKPEQAEQLRKAHCPDCDVWEFFTVINMMYAKHNEVARKLGVNRDDYYALTAKAFLVDEDAGPHKLAKYMENIPKK